MGRLGPTDEVSPLLPPADDRPSKPGLDSDSVRSDSTDSSSASSGDSAAAPRQLRLQAGLFGGCLLAGCCVAVMLPFFPTEAARRGLSHAASSLVFSSYALTQLLMFPVAGRLVPVVGVNRAFCGGLALAGCTTVAFGLLPAIQSSSGFLAACVAMRAAEATGTASLQTSARTMAAGQFPGRAGSALGLVETAVALGMSLGQGVGGALFALAGYGAPFHAVGGGMLAVALLGAWLLPPEPPAETAAAAGTGGGLRQLATGAEGWLSAAVVLVVSMNWTAVDPNLAPWAASELGLAPAALSLYFLVSSGCYSVSGLVWGRVCDRQPPAFLLTCCCLLLDAVSLLLMLPPPPLLAPSRALLAVGMLLRQVAQGGAYVLTISRLLTSQRDLAGRSAVAAATGVVFAAGFVIGPVAGGRIADLYGLPCTASVQAALNGCLAVPVAVLGVCEIRRRRGVRSGKGEKQVLLNANK